VFLLYIIDILLSTFIYMIERKKITPQNGSDCTFQNTTEY